MAWNEWITGCNPTRKGAITTFIAVDGAYVVPQSVGSLLATIGAQSLLLLEDPATVLFRLRGGDGNVLPVGEDEFPLRLVHMGEENNKAKIYTKMTWFDIRYTP